jgi:hypothetical protein
LNSETPIQTTIQTSKDKARQIKTPPLAASDSHLPAFRIELFDCALGKMAHGGDCPGARVVLTRPLDHYAIGARAIGSAIHLSATTKRTIGVEYAIST